MGSCCSGKDAVPDIKSRINTEDSKEDDMQPLIDTADKKSEMMEGIEVELETSSMITYILNITTFDLIESWKKVDIDNTDIIDIEKQLENIFLGFIDIYIEKQTGQKTMDTKYSKKAHILSKELSKQFQSILKNYNYDEGNTMTKDFYLENLQHYLAEPMPEKESEDEDEIDFDKQEVDVLSADKSPPETPTTEEYSEQFEMLSFISTSCTIRETEDFMEDVTVSLLRAAMESNKKERGEKVGEILASLTEKQRILVRNAYVGAKSESLQSALKDAFSGDLLLVLTELCRSSAYNDAEWIEKSRNKLNINTSVINEILMSRTNSQLSDIKAAYKERYGRNLLDSLKQSFNDTGSYGNLLKLILTDNDKILRKEFNPKYLKEKTIRDDAKILYHIMEITKGKLNKLKVIEMLCHRSWHHIAILCKEYGKKSKYDLKTMIEKKFGKNSKSGDALQKIIDISRNRHSFFAQLLFQSMKGMSVDDAMLIRIIVGRSGIDLGEIAAAFSQKYGNGKTLLQFIKANASKGTYRNILLRICAVGDHAIMHDDIDDDDDNDNASDIYSADDDCKVLENHHSLSTSRSELDGDEKDKPRQTWDEYICSSPTISSMINFDAKQIGEELIAVMNNKKMKKDAKRMLIQTLTQICNKQRQELKKIFFEIHPQNMELAEATQQTLRKGKTMIVMLGLLQRPSEFNCFWIKQAIKNKKIELLIEILCCSTNYEIKKMKEYYEKSTNSDLLTDIEKNIIGNKKTAKYLINKILEGRRPETTRPDRKLCKIHLTEMNKLLKQKNQKQCKQFFGKLFVENSYSQIKYEINKFNTASEHTLTSVVKKITGTGYSGVIIENIIKISTHRFGYFAEKLREAMKGITTDEQVMIRVLVGRSEKDLGDIVQYFAEENYGEGKTLKQWIQNTLKGSFRTSLLRIAGVCDELIDPNDEDPEDYESQTESDFISKSETPINKAVAVAAIMNSKASKSVGYPVKTTKSEPPGATFNDEQKEKEKVKEKGREREQKVSPKIVISSPSQIEEEIKLNKEQKLLKDKEYESSPPTPTDNNNNNESKANENENDEYDPYDINENEFGKFIMEKVNDKTAQRLMQHLKTGTNNDNNSDYDEEIIKANQCIHVLLFACVLFLKYKEKTEKRAEVQIDKKKLKKALMPFNQWMLENKLKDHQTIKKSDYKVLGKWLKEYYQILQKQ